MHIFNRVKHQTPESVELEFVLAGIGSRAWALLIDYHIVTISSLCFLIIFSNIVSRSLEFLTRIFGGNNLSNWLMAIYLLASFAIYNGYFVLFETLWQGQTPGKRIAKIRVVREDGRPVGLQQAALRALLRNIDDFLFTGAFLIVFTRREKRFGDMVAGTLVIQEQIPTKSSQFAISEQAQTLAKELPQIANISELLPDDFAVIREYLLRRNSMTPRAKAGLVSQLTQQAQNIIQLEKIPVGFSDDDFLEAIYLAYKKNAENP